MKKIGQHDSMVFSGVSPVQRETITQQFDVIRISFNERGIMGVSEHLEELNAIYSAGSDDVIEIRVSGCPGGSADTIQTIIHALIATPAHTVCVLSGTNSSAATMIPLVCSEVITTPYTSMMCHSVSGGNFGTMANQERSAVFFSKLYSDFTEDIYSNFLSPSELDDLKKGLEIYLDAEAIQERLEKRKKLLMCDVLEEDSKNACGECEGCILAAEVEAEVQDKIAKAVVKKAPAKKQASPAKKATKA